MEITIQTAQGIGDNLWCYQKLSPYYDKIRFEMFCIDNGTPMEIQMRSAEFLTMLPKYGGHEFIMEPPPWTKHMSIIHIKPYLPMHGGTVEYLMNDWLISGVRLDEIDPGAAVEWGVQLKGVPQDAPEEVSGVCLYIAGHKDAGSVQWSGADWADVAALAAARANTNTIKMVGAAWDVGPSQEAYDILVARGYDVKPYVGKAKLAETLAIMRGSTCFVGYQSGLSMLADNYDVPSLEVIFDHTPALPYMWCKPGHARTVYHAMHFNQLDRVAEKMPLKWR